MAESTQRSHATSRSGLKAAGVEEIVTALTRTFRDDIIYRLGHHAVNVKMVLLKKCRSNNHPMTFSVSSYDVLSMMGLEIEVAVEFNV